MWTWRSFTSTWSLSRYAGALSKCPFSPLKSPTNGTKVQYYYTHFSFLSSDTCPPHNGASRYPPARTPEREIALNFVDRNRLWAGLEGRWKAAWQGESSGQKAPLSRALGMGRPHTPKNKITYIIGPTHNSNVIILIKTSELILITIVIYRLLNMLRRIFSSETWTANFPSIYWLLTVIRYF